MIRATSILIMALTILTTMHVNAQKNLRFRDWSDSEIDAFLEKSELIPIMINGEKNNRINIVLMNRWSKGEKEPYNSPAMRDEFIKDINESLVAALTPGNEKAQTAYANYREFFNIYGLWFPDSPEWDKGINGKAVDAMRDKLFLPWTDENLGWATFLVLPNINNGGGGAGRNLEARTGRALIAGNQIAKMLHEIAHTCISVGDEYTGPATGTSANPTYSVSLEYDRDKIKWRKWIEEDTPLPTPYTDEYKDKIGAFEGCQYHLTGYYRSTAQGCIMGAGVFDNTERMCPICEQRLAMRVNKLVNPINSFEPANTSIKISGNTKLHFEIDHIRPNPNTQVVRWILNDKIIATGVDEVDVEFGELAAYNLTCLLTDESPLIRPDPPFAKYPTREINWSISNSAPSSNAEKLAVTIQTKQNKAGITLKSNISGGKAPFTYSWSNGSTEKALKNVKAGIYELQVIDSEFRSATNSYTVYENTLKINPTKQASSNGSLTLEANITASSKDKDNGKIEVSATGGTAPYTYVWKNATQQYTKGKVYEAEDAEIKITGHTIKDYFDANNNKYVLYNENEGSITWTIDIAKSGTYPIDISYAGVARKGTPMNISVNGETIDNSLLFQPTRPLYTGWEKATITANLKEGKNEVTLNSIGKSGANIDYLRVATSYESNTLNGCKRFNLKPGIYTVTATDQKNNSIEKTITVPEVYPFEIQNLEINTNKPGFLSITNPLPGYSYLWYTDKVAIFNPEKFEKALFEGEEFKPEQPGSYYISAKNIYSNVESSNRICVSVGDQNQSISTNEMSPGRLGEDHIKLWFDASDLDGDGNEDGAIPDRGPMKNWMEKTWRNPEKIFTKYEPNALNGLGVGAFGNVWVSDLSEKVSGIQTVILVYKESNLTFPGKCIFRGLNEYLGASSDPQKRIFDFDAVDKKTQNAKVYLNGVKIDPFNTPNPLEFCILTVEFESMVEKPFSRIEGFWEGDIAEMIFIDKPLSESERKGIEEHLRKKWLASFDIKF